MFFILALSAQIISKSFLSVFVGYVIEQKGYQFYDPEKQRICISINVIFWENISFMALRNRKSFAPETFVEPFLNLKLVP